MQKRKHKPQICARVSLPPSNQCRYCLIDFKNTLRSTLIQQSLLDKYGKSGIDASESSNYSRFIEGKSQVYKGGYQQFKRYYQPISQLIQYYDLRATSEKITSVIETHYKTNKFEPTSFRGKYLVLIHKHHKLRKGEKGDIKHSENVRSTETGDLRRYKKSSDKKTKQILHLNKKKKKVKDANVNESFEQILKLRKTIDRMCSKFKGDKIMNNFDQEMNSKKLSQEKKIKKKKTSLFQEQIQRKISEIKSTGSNSKNKKFNVRAQTQTEEIYGLDQYYKRSNSNGKKNGYNMNIRVETQKTYENVYDSPVSRAYYARNYITTEKSSMIGRENSKNFLRSRKKSISSKSKTKSFYSKKKISESGKGHLCTINSHSNLKKKTSKSKKKKI